MEELPPGAGAERRRRARQRRIDPGDVGEDEEEGERELGDDQRELDRYWNAFLEAGGEAQACGWLIDRFGVRWQIVPAALDEMVREADPVRSKRVTWWMSRVPIGIPSNRGFRANSPSLRMCPTSPRADSF